MRRREIRAINGTPVTGQRDVVFGLLDAMSARGEADLQVRAADGGSREARLDVRDATERRHLTEPSQLFRGLGFQFWTPPVPPLLGQVTPDGPAARAGLDAYCLPWLHEREVAVYSGDCVERIPYPSKAVPLPLHQIGLVAMGLVLLDCPRLAELVAACEETGRREFMLTVAPLRLRGATGSPANPLCLF